LGKRFEEEICCARSKAWASSWPRACRLMPDRQAHMDEGPCIREWRRKLSLTWTNERGGREQMKLKSASELQLKKESLVLTKPGRGPKYSLDGGVRAARRFRERLRCPKWEAWRGSSSPRDGGCMAGFPSRIEGCPNLDLERGQPMICSVFWKIELSYHGGSLHVRQKPSTPVCPTCPSKTSLGTASATREEPKPTCIPT
jgi:hypothetical protein